MPLQGQAAVDQLLQLLDLKQIDAATFTGESPQTGAQRVFGGQVAGQALVAAGRTVPSERTVHSLHGYFVRPGDPTVPIDFHVETIRDGRSFSVRRSTAQQNGRTIFFMSASFQVHEEGLDHPSTPPADVPGPAEVPTMHDWVKRYPERAGAFNAAPQAIDLRYVGVPGWVPPGDREVNAEQRVWMRINGTLPDDPLIHACALTYASDLSLLDAVLSTHGEVWGPGGVIGASLDHALWFHRPYRADEWFLYDCTSPSASGARGLASGKLFTESGVHIASAVQEGLLRRVGAGK
ncbi:acyl-CoA thioesterase II [Actinoplanes sp. NPDC051470]|uniref:acyl-CoA thioesterase n=1 Tax=Actinoplanes sp. NPDC051470 TaxID=3157224 RepID=UPI00342179D6